VLFFPFSLPATACLLPVTTTHTPPFCLPSIPLHLFPLLRRGWILRLISAAGIAKTLPHPTMRDEHAFPPFNDACVLFPVAFQTELSGAACLCQWSYEHDVVVLKTVRITLAAAT